MSVFGAGRHKLAVNRYDSQFSMPLSTLSGERHANFRLKYTHFAYCIKMTLASPYRALH
jgi:hypothetical protein